jgi:SAM-dependent methyltransferase
MTCQPEIDALSDDRQWYGGWYQPILFSDGSRTHSTKMSDERFYGSESRGLRKWDRVIRPHLPDLTGKRFLEIGCNAGLYLVQAVREGAAACVGVENHPQFAKQCRYVRDRFGVSDRIHLLEQDAAVLDWGKVGFADVALLSNALYRIGHTDERGDYPNRPELLDRFLYGLSGAVPLMVVIGAEEQKRYANLGSTCGLLDPYFRITYAEVVPLNDRTMNVVVGESYARRAGPGSDCVTKEARRAA